MAAMGAMTRVMEALIRRNPPLCEKCGERLPTHMVHHCKKDTKNFLTEKETGVK